MPANLGTKHTCFKCGTKFYDLKKPEPVCPKCGADQRESPALRAPTGGGRRAKEGLGACDERSPVHYSITSSARASTAGGIVRPSAFAVFRLRTSSTLVDCCTGRSAGFSPLRMRPT